MRRSRLLGAVLLGTSLAGLAGLQGAGAAAAPAPAFTWRQQPVSDSSNYTEPSVSVREDGHIVVCAPGGGGNAYYWSSDDGKTFHDSRTAGGGGDCEIQFMPDGSLVSSDLDITTSIIHVSKDGGATWERTEDAGLEQDRQWFAAHGDVLYHVYHSITHEYEFFVRSTDGGRTWSEPVLINSPDQLVGMPGVVAKPGDTASLVDQGYNTFSGPMVVDEKTGDLYVAYSLSNAQSNVAAGHGFGPTRGIVVAHSGQNGDLGSWTNRYAVVTNDLSPQGGTVNGAIFPWITIDEAGTVYVLFNSNEGGTFHTYYVYSTDKTKTWSAPIRVDAAPDNVGATVYATGQAGAPGVLDIAWMESDNGEGPDDIESVWHVEFAQVRDAASATPQITRSRVSNHVIHNGQICQMGLLCITGGDRSLGDFFELALGPDGMAHIAWADNGNPDEPRMLYWAKQTSGASAFDAAPAPTKPRPGKSTVKPKPRPAPPPGRAAPRRAALPSTGLDDALPVLALVLLGLAGAALTLRRRRT